ncbi:unnamed protein product [Musa acuminata subsp. malaccensis]|uniref:(wild Malaysian banana) hypothetical protein n=1 Tax=Musa acuminata subsp. malaccensis TaxID=214687 RepID=A0A804ILK6_MUSAM|nr:unnamed protein product [Musa acuminata subsp. malaccensis]
MQSDRMVISLRPGGGAGNCPHGSTPHPLAATPQLVPSPFSPSFAPPAPPSLLRLENQGLGVMNMSITQGINFCMFVSTSKFSFV